MDIMMDGIREMTEVGMNEWMNGHIIVGLDDP